MKLMVRNRNSGKTYANGSKKPPNWEWRFRGAMVNGKRTEFSKAGYATKREAQEAGNNAIAEYTNTGSVFSPNNISVHDYLDYWINTYGKNNLKETTVQQYMSAIRVRIDPVIGNYYLKDITTAKLQEIIYDQFNNGASRGSLSNLKGILTSSMRYAVTPCGFIKNNPAASLTLPGKRAKPEKIVKRRQRDAITDSEWEFLMERFPEGHIAHVPFVLGYRCGLRAGEIFGLMWDDIDFENNTITVNRQMQRVNKHYVLTAPKYESYRTIYVDADTMALLARTMDLQEENRKTYAEYFKPIYVSNIRNEGHPFSHGDFTESGTEVHMVITRENGSLYTHSNIVTYIDTMHRNGIMDNFVFHSLRHSHATKLLEAGVSIQMIQKRLGHSNLAMTSAYIHTTDKMEDDLKKMIEKIY